MGVPFIIELPTVLKHLYWITLLVPLSLKGQPYLTSMRAAYTVEYLGIGPGLTVSGEIPLKYYSKGFWNLQAGIGMSGNLSGVSPSLSGGMSYNVLLNPYHRNLCSPYPNYNKFEAYFEVGVGVSMFDDTHAIVPEYLQNGPSIFSMGLIGFRLHLISKKWIYIIKTRFSPVLTEEMSPWGGVAIGIGWK